MCVCVCVGGGGGAGISVFAPPVIDKPPRLCSLGGVINPYSPPRDVVKANKSSSASVHPVSDSSFIFCHCMQSAACVKSAYSN